jgi:hypothetical protein
MRAEPLPPEAAPLPAAELLEVLGRALARQRSAIVAGDTAAVARLSETLAALLPELAALVEAPVSPLTGEGEALEERLAAAARQVREQIRINQTILRVGVAAAHHFVLAVAGDGAEGDPALFSGSG